MLLRSCFFFFVSRLLQRMNESIAKQHQVGREEPPVRRTLLERRRHDNVLPGRLECPPGRGSGERSGKPLFRARCGATTTTIAVPLISAAVGGVGEGPAPVRDEPFHVRRRASLQPRRPDPGHVEPARATRPEAAARSDENRVLELAHRPDPAGLRLEHEVFAEIEVPGRGKRQGQVSPVQDQSLPRPRLSTSVLSTHGVCVFVRSSRGPRSDLLVFENPAPVPARCYRNNHGTRSSKRIFRRCEPLQIARYYRIPKDITIE